MLHALRRRKFLEKEMHEELRFHLACPIEDNIKAGMNPREARRSALRNFGGVDQTKEECRDSRGFRLFSELRQDLRYSLRRLIRNPGFTVLVALILALGIVVAILAVLAPAKKAIANPMNALRID